MHFTLYSRSYCHLCQDMLDALLLLQPPDQPFTVDVIDIDDSPDASLLARFDELVPVLFGDLAQPALCHYFLDEAAVRRCLV
ncbi:glutaredoxin family protein [Janthinobacterium sp. GW458P]|uniref:glutaredoxin family protein n=1 Tax=Janthinobacterium sp. GW458P TaxID=1981504 RepID=UPI000A326110|nr:glutaredoxin family protein [Janthinobacterium sp. GW458P]MBE3025469.1 glutaredoxin family protein [Janthinobacterium sp. GW458P]